MLNMLYHFPKVRFVDENNIYGQVAHIQTEADEAFRELSTGDIDALADEIMDTMHSCETAMRILEKSHGVNPNAVMMRVYEKNEKRGYYQ